MENSEKITEKFTAVSLTILRDSRNELYLNMRYLDLALSGLRFSVTTELKGIGTDGEYLYVHHKILADLYEKDRHLVNRVYLHCVMHCLLRHIFKAPKADDLLWRLSSDIAVESIIDSMNHRSVRVGVSRLRKNTYDALSRDLKVLTAEGIWRVLMDKKMTHQLPDFQLTRLKEEFCIDDHSLWPKSDDSSPDRPSMPMISQLKNKWQDLSEKTQTEMETIGREDAQGAGDMEHSLQVENRERYDYRAFLRKFAVMREEMQVDPDSFDYIFYTFGLSTYGNMPLIEPQEFKEVKKIEEFVIVIDVSMSTSGDLVKTFLEQTYRVLSESESYLKKVNIRILQADEEVREDVKITSRKDLDEYMKNFTLAGGGGTDFRPAFSYVKELIGRGEFCNLKGMIYFTDGYGVYPTRRPAWETAFVFMEEDYTDVNVPPWAIKLILEKEDLEEEKQSLRGGRKFVWEEDQK